MAAATTGKGNTRLTGHWANRRWPVIVLAVAAAAVAMVAAVRWLRPSAVAPAIDRPLAGHGDDVPRSPEVIEAERRYRQAIQELFASWDRQPAARRDVARLQGRLLELGVPGRYRTLHLDLAIALSFLRGGEEGESSNTAEGLRRLDAVFQQESWILAVPPAAEQPEDAQSR